MDLLNGLCATLQVEPELGTGKAASTASSYPPAAALALPQCGNCLCQDYSEEERSDRWEHLVGRAFSELFDARVFQGQTIVANTDMTFTLDSRYAALCTQFENLVPKCVMKYVLNYLSTK